MYKQNDRVYVVQGAYPEDVVINELTVVHQYESTVWVQDEEENNFLADLSELIPNRKAASERALELVNLTIQDLQEEILVQKVFKKELKEDLASIKAASAKNKRN